MWTAAAAAESSVVDRGDGGGGGGVNPRVNRVVPYPRETRVSQRRQDRAGEVSTEQCSLPVPAKAGTWVAAAC